jgi:probable HAF family extracellular repeat protein
VQFTIDKDIEDAQIADGIPNKSYSFSQQTSFLAPSNPAGTSPQGISDISDAQYSGGTLPVGNLGDLIVGWWYNPYCPGCGTFGFIYDPNTSNFLEGSLDVDGNAYTYLQGINNAALVVGYDLIGAFTYDANVNDPNYGAVTYLNPSWCTDCAALGINDAGWVAGGINVDWYNYPDNPPQGFVLKPGESPMLLNYGVWNEISGINGQGLVTGYYSPDGNNVYGFIADASQSTISVLQDSIVCPTGYTVMYTGAINNNGQVVGYSEGGGPADGFWFDANGCQDLGPSFTGGSGVAYGLNDLAQITGELSGGQNNPGVVLVPTQQ